MGRGKCVAEVRRRKLERRTGGQKGGRLKGEGRKGAREDGRKSREGGSDDD